jgi:hypothetical protein
MMPNLFQGTFFGGKILLDAAVKILGATHGAQ